jgi:hypothetical protein
MRPAVCLNSGLDSANFRDHLRVGECQKPFEELAAILWIHKRSGGSFRKFQKQLIWNTIIRVGIDQAIDLPVRLRFGLGIEPIARKLAPGCRLLQLVSDGHRDCCATECSAR